MKKRECKKLPEDFNILNKLKLLQQQIFLLTVSDIEKIK